MRQKMQNLRIKIKIVRQNMCIGSSKGEKSASKKYKKAVKKCNFASKN